MSKNRLKANGPVLKSLDDVESAINDVALLTTNKSAVCAEMDRQNVAIVNKYKPALATIDHALAEKVAQLEAWAMAHHEEFQAKRSIQFGLGTIGFRIDPPKVALLNRKWDWTQALEKVRCYLGTDFIRTKSEVNKEAILERREETGFIISILRCGLKITQEEKFYVEPRTTETEKRQVKEAA